jgi:hypothetical protein
MYTSTYAKMKRMLREKGRKRERERVKDKFINEEE